MLRTFPRKLADWLGWNQSDSGTKTPASPGIPAWTQQDVGTAVELFNRLAEITSTVAGDVKHHSGNIQSINDELGAIRQGDTSAVAAAIARLQSMNRQTQQRLAQAELRLATHQRQIAEVATAAKTDPLTGVANRRGLDEELAQALAKFEQRQRPAALLILDLDHFKAFNDRYGLPAGDQALQHLGTVLLAKARESDAVARLGGEEFAVVLHGAKAADVLERAENLRRAMSSASILYAGHELHITASAGLAELQAGDTAQTLVKRASDAVVAAKCNGRNCTYWHSAEGLKRISRPGEEPALSSTCGAPAAAAKSTAAAAPGDAAKPPSVELAADQFADSTFVGQVSRRVAEWRRGGATFSVALVRVAFPTANTPSGSQPGQSPEARRTALRIVHQFARASLRDMDLVTRWNDDGLAILLPGSLVTDAAGVANRLRTAIEKHNMPPPFAGLTLSLWAGVAEVIEGNDVQRVLHRAQMALDAAAATGEGKVFLHDGLRPAAV
jgi:diguanylate cyclase (GGDEF)-like protein